MTWYIYIHNYIFNTHIYIYVHLYLYILSFFLSLHMHMPSYFLPFDPSTSSASAPQGCCHWWGLNLDEAKSGRPQRPHGSVLDPTYGVCIVSDKKKTTKVLQVLLCDKKPASLPTLIKSFFFLLSLSRPLSSAKDCEPISSFKFPSHYISQ